MKKFLIKTAKILGLAIVSALICLFLIFRFFFPEFMPGSHGHVGKFTKEDLDAICGVELRQDDRDYCGIEYMRYWNNRNVPTEFDGLDFYVFDSNFKAKRAYNKMKKNGFSDIKEEGKDYVIGTEAGTMDAVCVNYIYIHNNLIIRTTVECYSEWAVDPDDPNPPQPYIKDSKAVDSLVRNNF